MDILRRPMVADPLLDAFTIAARRNGLDGAPGFADTLTALRALPPSDTVELDRRLAEDPLLPHDLGFRLRKLLPSAATLHDYPPFRPLAHLATGGMGVLWLAAAPDGGLVVLKTLRGELSPLAGGVEVDAEGEVWLAASPQPTTEPSPGAAMLQRLEREARLHRQLQHPHIVTCFEHGLTRSGLLYMVLEYCGSGDLAGLLAERGALPEPLALTIADQVAAGLEAAHRLELVHRDVKPSNVFLLPDGTAKLADFGFARSTRADRTRLTIAGTVLGSPACMAPEQIGGASEIDIRCDLYALGCVLFHCLAGHPPFQGSRSAVMRRHCVDVPPDLPAGISVGTAAIVRRLLGKQAAERPADPAALRRELAVELARHGLEPLARLPLPDRTPVATPRPVPPPAIADSSVCPLPDSGFVDDPASGTQEPPDTAPPSTGLAADWLLLDGGDGEVLLSLYGRPRLTLGKLRDPSVDVCLRNYPEAEHRQACVRISRQHCALSIDPGRGAAWLQDLGSANGTSVDGTRLPPGRPFTIDASREHILDIAQVMTLRLRLLPRRPGPPPPRAETGGLDAIVLRRPKNRPGLAYALVQGCISIGGADADLPVPGAGGRTWIGRADGCWWVSEDGRATWRGLEDGAGVALGSRTLTARTGSPAAL